MLPMGLIVIIADHGCTFSDDRYQSCTGLAGLVTPLANGFLLASLDVGISPVWLQSPP